ncbi:hypothetical protein ADIAL_1401 [Alkalibacterium sp. AK22]|nr:hypothetical protein ADIAL_1401 [Alkalibacterium sp. AK22]
MEKKGLQQNRKFLKKRQELRINQGLLIMQQAVKQEIEQGRQQVHLTEADSFLQTQKQLLKRNRGIQKSCLTRQQVHGRSDWQHS